VLNSEKDSLKNICVVKAASKSKRPYDRHGWLATCSCYNVTT